MTTTRKDLYRIADALAETRPLDDVRVESGLDQQWLNDIAAVADALNVTSGLNTNGNRRFDRDRFYEACGAKES